MLAFSSNVSRDVYRLDGASYSVFEEPNKLAFVPNWVNSRENQTPSARMEEQIGLKGLTYMGLYLTFFPAWSDFVFLYMIFIWSSPVWKLW